MEENTRDECQYPRCKLQSDLIYLGMGLCDPHWVVIAEMPTAEAYKKLGIERKEDERDNRQPGSE